MIDDPISRGRSLGEFYFRMEPALWRDIVDSGQLPDDDDALARAEWECFALYACVRGLVAAGGFGEENMQALDALHDAVAEGWDALANATPADTEERRERVAQRYDEYGEIARTQAPRGEDVVTTRLGEAAARHVCGTDIAPAELGTMLGELHEAVAQGAAEHVREATV